MITAATTPICGCFDRHASHYDAEAGLQRAVAWRLAQLTAALPLPAGPRADLGAGTGLVGQALLQQQQQQQQLSQPELLQVDGSPTLLQRNPLVQRSDQQLLWDLNEDLPAALQGSALITSSFSLQWLQQPAERLQHWAAALRPGGWLVLAVPVAGCFPQWHEAARRARVPCTARALPAAQALVAAAATRLRVQRQQTLVFSRRYSPAGLGFLQQLRRLGAGHSDQQPLSPSQWRQLLLHWPVDDRVSWHILVLLGQR